MNERDHHRMLAAGIASTRFAAETMLARHLYTDLIVTRYNVERRFTCIRGLLARLAD